MDELLALEKDVKRRIQEEERILLNSGLTHEDLSILYEALEYISYPVIAEFFERRKTSK